MNLAANVQYLDRRPPIGSEGCTEDYKPPDISFGLDLGDDSLAL